MSKKRKMDVISWTGVEQNHLPETTSHSKTLLDSVTVSDIVKLETVNSATGERFVPRSLLRADSLYLYIMLASKDDTKLEVHISKVGLELFLQWLYTRQYFEEDRRVTSIEFNDQYKDNYTLETAAGGSITTMSWKVKAAIISCSTGSSLECPKFLNYAMSRLFLSFSQAPSEPPITPSQYRHMMGSISLKEVKAFYEDLVIRNWGDISIVNHKDPAWSGVLKDSAHLRDKFVRAAATPLEKRRARPMDLNRYLVKEN